jgi:hypothetical protein
MHKKSGENTNRKPKEIRKVESETWEKNTKILKVLKNVKK